MPENHLNRRAFLAAAVTTPLLLSPRARAESSFERWVAAFRPRALARGVSAATYDRVMTGLKPDTHGLAAIHSQDEFREQLWQYLNRRVSDWRIITGKERARQYADLLGRIERDFGVDRYIMLALWGVESSYGDVVTNPKYMRPVFPSLAALAYEEPRRRAYWEAELINALIIVERGWAKPDEMIGSWAGAMGHTQWMPEVWLHVGVDYDHNGRPFPYGPPDDALAGTAKFLLERGKYRRGEAWGCEVKLAAGADAGEGGARTYAQWHERGVVRADGRPFDRPGDHAHLTRPVPGGPAFLLGQNFAAVKSYNPAFSYALAVCHLGDRIAGAGPFVQPFPNSERLPTLAEVQEIQRRLTALGYDTDGTDGRVGRDTMRAVAAYQKKIGMQPADGYAGVKLLARLRQGS
ncbi:MAG TPA: lytic murein transglycosylase [Xanthobacteraceae bacterium]|nr:lytic murein transglycosylase [Xanthobacteraceae bacterium]